jgi:hypothetical protein
MFEDWKRAWREAVDNFHREMQAGDPQMPPRVRAMERELVSAAGALTKLDHEIRRARAELAAEQDSEQVCRRRETLARNAGDDETVRVAAEYAARHAERAGVLTRKLAVLHDERALLDRDIREMRRLVSDAAAAAPAGTVGNASTSAEPVEGAAAGDRDFSRLERDARERAAAERLEELKRRMQG